MPSMKRPAASAVTKSTAPKAAAAKRARHAADPKTTKYQEIAEAVRSAEGFPQEMLNALAGIVKVSLAAPKDVRHRFAETQLGMLEEVLRSTETASREKVLALESKVGESNTEKAAREAAATATQERETERGTEVEAAKTKLAATSEETSKAAAALQAAQQAKKTADDDYASAGERKAKLESVRDKEYAAVKETPSVKGTKAFVKAAQGFRLDVNMLKAAESTLTKSMTERGMFDNLVVTELDAAFDSAIKAEAETLAQGEPVLAEHTTSVAAAQADADVRGEEEKAAKTALVEAQGTLATAVVDRKAAARAVKDFGPEMKRAATELAAASQELQAALAVVGDFQGLRGRSTAAPVEEKVAGAEPAATAEEGSGAAPASA